MPKLSSPETLTIPQFRDWRQRWEDYSRSQQLQSQPIDSQQGILRSALDNEWTMLWNSSRIRIAPSTDLSIIIELMEAYLRRRRNPLLDRQAFHRRDQQPGECVDRYFAALKELDDACDHDAEFKCKTCNDPCHTECNKCSIAFPLTSHLQEIRIRDRLICGLIDKDMQRRVLTEQYTSEITLDHVLSICTAVENSKKMLGFRATVQS
ncbi:unnamed protein product [Phaedon cochleariae]|uniref:Uncharacterized protein n=1 Tax=Phaedon cochleariae TaxID=80249 RepID=A0A9N9SA92_PHACE|nr:unnamed protein product [Phaedon cochleariae]